MRRTRQRGFTIIEIMIVVVIVGILAAIAIPMFSGHMKKAKTGEAELQLNMIGKNAKNYYQTHSTYPQGTAAVLPGADGTACGGSSNSKFATSTAWAADSVWTALDFHIDEPGYFSYHYTGTSMREAEALAVGDLDCDSKFSTYTLTLTVPEGQPAAALVAPKNPD